MARSAKFRIWESKPGRFHRETLFGNRVSPIKSDQHFTSVDTAIAVVTDDWICFAKALGVYGKHTKATFLATHPVPYAKDSLRPIAKRPYAKDSLKANRLPAVAKIIEGAKISKTDLPAATPAAVQRAHELAQVRVMKRKGKKAKFGRRVSDAGITAVA